MATIRKILELSAPPDAVWDALADFAAVHERVAPGFVFECRSDGGDRIVTFADSAGGAVVRERLVSLDHDERRLVYTVVDGALGSSHHQASVRILAVEQPDRCRMVWTTDFLPHEHAAVINRMMDLGVQAIERHFSSAEVTG